MKIKNWSQFQHFKDRRPPWIKLHREVLEQRDINMLSDCSFRVLVGLWLLASEDKAMEGNLPDVEEIAFRLRIDKSKIIKALKELTPFLYQDDINAISQQYQVDVPEKSREEAETEGETDTKVDSVVIIEYLNQAWGSQYKPVKSNLSLINALLKEGHSSDDIKKVIDHKISEWGHDAKMSKFIRPATLFNAGKFNQYVGQVGIANQERGRDMSGWLDEPSKEQVIEGEVTRD